MDFTKQTYCNQVTSYIRSLIRKGTLEIGAPVKEAVLSEQLSAEPPSGKRYKCSFRRG